MGVQTVQPPCTIKSIFLPSLVSLVWRFITMAGDKNSCLKDMTQLNNSPSARTLWLGSFDLLEDTRPV